MGKDFPKDMKTKRKRIETISETTTLLLLKNLNNSTRQSWCGQCQADVFWISPTEINLFGIYELPLAAVHRIGNLICSHSLFKEFVKGKNNVEQQASLVQDGFSRDEMNSTSPRFTHHQNAIRTGHR